MNKAIAIIMAIMLLMIVTAVPAFAEGTNTVPYCYEETEIINDESEAKAYAATLEPSVTDNESEKSDTPLLKKTAENAAQPSELSVPQIISEDTEGEWSLNLDGFDDFFSYISFGDIFGGLISETTPELGEPFEDEGNAYTRDVLYDKDCHKQFITVQTRSGNTFYIVIDYDSCINESEEQYQVYFLNMVDEADLLALLDEETAEQLTTCICKDKCDLGKVAADCPVCKNDLTDCKGKEPEPKKEQSPAEEEAKKEDKPTKKSSMLPIIFVVVAVAAGGLGFYYFRFIKGRKKEDMDFYDDEGYEEEYVNEDEQNADGDEYNGDLGGEE